MRRTFAIYASVLGTSVATAGLANAAPPLEVGPGKAFATPCAAIAAAKPGDVVEVTAGTYTDTCAIGVKGLTLRGVNGRPKIDLSGTDHPAQYKGAYVITADDVRIENLEISGVHISPDNGENGAGVRIQANGAVISGCHIHDNQNGILGAPLATGTGTLTIEHTEFSGNGVGNGCNGSGCTHNVYLGAFAKVVFQYNWSHSIATDTADKGHLLKSRAEATYVLYNLFTGEGGPTSYEVEMPNGGLGVVVGNVIQQAANTGNPSMLAYGLEGLARSDHRLFVVNNTFVNDLGKGTFINAAGGTTLTVRNNLFVGAGTQSSLGSVSADNLSGLDPLFVNRAGHDYHLQSGSPAIDKGVAPGSADAFDLTPSFEHVPGLKGVPRKGDLALDVGAFEFGTDLSGASNNPPGGVGPDGGVANGGGLGGATSNPGAPGAPSNGGANNAGATGDPGAAGASDAESSGCSVSATLDGRAGGPRSSSAGIAFALAMSALGAIVRRRRVAARRA